MACCNYLVTYTTSEHQTSRSFDAVQQQRARNFEPVSVRPTMLVIGGVCGAAPYRM